MYVDPYWVGVVMGAVGMLTFLTLAAYFLGKRRG